jgi:HEAT repeat protein
MADDQKFLADIQSDNADVRFTAWRQAGEVSPAVIPQLGKQAGSDNPGMAKAAREALTTMVHFVGKDPAAANRAAVVKGLLGLAGAGSAPSVRVHALRLLSNIAGEDSVPAIAKWIQTPALAEEVVFCLERIPGSAPNKVLMAAYKDAKDEFKPRILAALGHRRAADAVGLSVEAMRSPNLEIAVAGVKAFGRIGRKPASAPRYPDTKAMSEWQRIDQMDSLLRYADAQAKEGSVAEAIGVYKSALARSEEHWQCAAVIGLGKIGTAEAAAAILPKLKSENPKVRITAENTWKGMAGAKV